MTVSIIQSFLSAVKVHLLTKAGVAQKRQYWRAKGNAKGNPNRFKGKAEETSEKWVERIWAFPSAYIPS